MLQISRNYDTMNKSAMDLNFVLLHILFLCLECFFAFSACSVGWMSIIFIFIQLMLRLLKRSTLVSQA